MGHPIHLDRIAAAVNLQTIRNMTTDELIKHNRHVLREIDTGSANRFQSVPAELYHLLERTTEDLEACYKGTRRL